MDLMARRAASTWWRPMTILFGAVAMTMAMTTARAAAPLGDTFQPLGPPAEAPGPWREVRLKADLKPNAFTFRRWDGLPALEVRSEAAMSLMARPIEVDLARTPILCWRWRIDAPLQRADIATRAGDDVAARLYVSLRVPDARKSLALRAQLAMARAIWGPDVPDAAINYVWDNRYPAGSERPNAYTERTTMVVVRSGGEGAGRWVNERRDLRADVQRLHGAGTLPVQLALAADTDNTGEAARAGFAEIHLVPDGEACRHAPLP